MTKTSRIVIGIIVAILVILLAISVIKKAPTDGPIKIGVMAPLTGPFAAYGEEIEKGVRAALASTTAVQAVFEDDKCEPKDAVTAFHKLTDIDGAHFIIGPGCGSPQEAVVPLLDEKKVVVIVPSAASKALFEKSGGNFFNIQYSLEDESKYIAETMTARGYKNVALVTYANAFSNTHAASFRENFKGKIAIDAILTDDNQNILPELTKIKAAKVDGIYAPDVAFFFAGGSAKLKQLGLKMPVFTTYVAELPSVIPLVEGAYYSFPADIQATGGAVYNLSKQAAETLIPAITTCSGEPLCVKGKLASSGKFDGAGVYKRDIALKQIVNGAATSTVSLNNK